MLVCPFESTAHISKSAFCPPSVFTSREYKEFAYRFDLDKFYNTGYGQPLGRVQGVGYVNELLARLSKKPVEDRTQTNWTLDHNWETFPLDRNFYVDFTHDNAMVAVYGALGLFEQPEMLDPEHPDKRRTWRANEMVPFSSRMVTEKLTCGHEGKEYVRIMVNDALQPLEFCGTDGTDGLCELHKFVKSQRYARHNGEGDWEKCFE
jgi:hypothetical protein